MNSSHSGPTTFDLDDFRPTPLELGRSNGERVDQKGQKKKSFGGLGLRRNKVDMTPTEVELEVPDTTPPPPQATAIDQTVTQFQSKGTFPKRGSSLKPTASKDIAAEMTPAEQFHLGRTKLTDGLPAPALRRVTSQDGNSGDGDGGGMSFSAFDDMLANATVGGK